MVTGRRPKPTVLHMLRGNPSRKKLNHDPETGPLSPECPPELSSADARAEWERGIVPAIRVGQITERDRIFAIAHCELWATWRSQLADAARHPHVVSSGPTKHPIPNPARCMANKTFLLLARVDVELGFTPSSRSRIVVEPKAQSGQQPQDKWAGVLPHQG
jgi:P27 family predicted phage terminase small subunit